MKILLLGSDGQLGKYLSKNISNHYVLKSYNRKKLDLHKLREIEKEVNLVNPDIIINAAAYTNVEKAEKEEKKAFDINHKVPKELSRIALKKNIWLIHFSTDYVFDGKQKHKYSELDQTNPQNIYGKSKLAGEIEIEKSKCNYIIFRTSWIYDIEGFNFIKKIIERSLLNRVLKVVKDQYGVPTSTELIGKVTLEAIKSIEIDKSWPSGIYNLVPNGETNWYEMSLLIKKIDQIIYHKFDYEKKLLDVNIEGINSLESKFFAKRPKNSLMINDKIQKVISFKLPYWEENFIKTTKKILKKYRDDY